MPTSSRRRTHAEAIVSLCARVWNLLGERIKAPNFSSVQGYGKHTHSVLIQNGRFTNKTNVDSIYFENLFHYFTVELNLKKRGAYMKQVQQMKMKLN